MSTGDKLHIVSWSGGKDSTATIVLAHEHELPIDLIIICLVWFDKKRGIYAEYPEVIEWIFNTAIPLFESWGYKVKLLESERDYMYWFNHKIPQYKVKEWSNSLFDNRTEIENIYTDYALADIKGYHNKDNGGYYVTVFLYHKNFLKLSKRRGCYAPKRN